MARSSAAGEAAYRLLPSVDVVLRDPRVAALEARAGRTLLASLAAAALEAWRAEIRQGRLGARELEERLARGELALAIEAGIRREDGAGVRRAINATGVVLHTGLGRAPLHREAAEAMAAAAHGYALLELDRETGERGERDRRVAELAVRLFGGEAATAVNNNAGAVLLLLNTFAAGREAIVSRGELVEIGGSFRMPDVMARAGVTLREVGTTNRTRLADYRAAVTERTGLLLKVHTSNFRVQGFTEEVSAAELAGLGRELGIPTGFDVGSGWLRDERAPGVPGLEHEPEVRVAVLSGVDVVTFSGDKLLGAPQAGFAVGRSAAIAALHKNPIYRALRLDKVALAGLERTLELWLAGRGAEIPARALLALGAAELRPRAEALARELRAAGYATEVVEDGSEPGSGSAPGVLLPTCTVVVRHARLSADALARGLREHEPPVFARIAEGAVRIDPRTLLGGDEGVLAAAFRFIAAQSR